MLLSISDLINSNDWRCRFTRHGLFWLAYQLLFTYLGAATYGVAGSFSISLRWLPFTILITYVSLYWLVSQYLLHSRYTAFALLLTGWTMVAIFLAFLTHLYVVYPYCWDPGPRPSFRQALPELFDLYPILVCSIITLFAVFIRMYKSWRAELLQKLQLKQEKTDAELELLRAQLHPHFLFNTLNNLYTLILEKSSRAPEMLLRLSAILSYVLNECQAAEVPLEKEVAFCRDYIELESERYGDRLEITANFSGDLSGKMIPPMLFQPFIENAFKHGAAEQVGKVWINIELTIRQNQLLFRVANGVDSSVQRHSTGGIGIANIQRRLHLLYPGRYRFSREQAGGMHLISLSIELESVESSVRLRRAKKSPKLVEA